MLRRHPISTLFPYTTLFRSFDVRDEARGGGHEAIAERRGAQTNLAGANLGIRRRAVRQAIDIARSKTLAVGNHRHELDRKSTRLNSSHVSISYAVFCLKKKR